MKNLLLTLILPFLCCGQVVIDVDGIKIQLNPDKTWEYYDVQQIVDSTDFTPTKSSKDHGPVLNMEHVEPPIFPGCEKSEEKQKCFQDKIAAHIAKHLKYPKLAYKHNVQGRVYVNFSIDVDGKVVDVKTLGKLPYLNPEAYRIISLLPRMKPAMKDGEAVKYTSTIPISFVLEKKFFGK